MIRPLIYYRVPFINLAILPSAASNIAAKTIETIARLKSLVIVNFIDVNPKINAKIVIILGMTALKLILFVK